MVSSEAARFKEEQVLTIDELSSIKNLVTTALSERVRTVAKTLSEFDEDEYQLSGKKTE